MAPVHDTDLSEKRWEHEEWRRFELWERIERRFRRNRNLVLVGAVLAFLGLSSIPIWMERGPRYRAVEGARELAELLNRLKLEVARTREPIRLVLSGEPGLGWRMERAPGGCIAAATSGAEVLRQGGLLVKRGVAGEFKFVSESEGLALGVPGLGLEFCYDPISGSQSAADGKKLAGFAIAPVGDLTAGRVDRLGTVVVRGSVAESRFE